MLIILYLIAGYWAAGKTVYASPAVGRWQESFPRRALVGFLLGWVLIPLAVFNLLTEP